MTEEMYLRDINTEIWQMIVDDEQLRELIPDIEKHVFQYHVPEESQQDSPIIRVSMIDMLPDDYADNKQMSFNYVIQIDVWHKYSPFEIAQHINRLMKNFNFKQASPTFEYDPDTTMLRDGRRYEGKVLLDKPY